MTKSEDEKPDFTLPVAALYDKVDRDLLLQFAEKYPDVKFVIYAPNSGTTKFFKFPKFAIYAPNSGTSNFLRSHIKGFMLTL